MMETLESLKESGTAYFVFSRMISKALAQESLRVIHELEWKGETSSDRSSQSEAIVLGPSLETITLDRGWHTVISSSGLNNLSCKEAQLYGKSSSLITAQRPDAALPHMYIIEIAGDTVMHRSTLLY